MQCSRCGAPVQPGMTFCPNCGTPYAPAQNAPGAAPIPPTQYDPTVVSPPYNPGQAFPPPANPTPSQPGYGDYNMQPANPYAPQAPNPYNAPGSYGTPPPPPDAFNAQNAYGAPPPPNVYGAPYTPSPGAFMPPKSASSEERTQRRADYRHRRAAHRAGRRRIFYNQSAQSPRR